MDLVTRIKEIAKQEGIEESELILNEARFFLKEHEGHGLYDMVLEYDGDEISGISLKCMADKLEKYLPTNTRKRS